jgi:hypothetical protein
LFIGLADDSTDATHDLLRLCALSSSSLYYFASLRLSVFA